MKEVICLAKRFSIGEMAKINNLSVQALRHYDKVGIIKPSYINEETGYRYYSANQFVIVDLIKQCKAMGLSLDEIKEIIEGYDSTKSILETIGKQKDIIDNKIWELNKIKSNITFLEDSINISLKEGLDSIVISEYEEREFVRYGNTKRFTEEFELELSETLANIEKEYHCFNKELGFVISSDELLYEDKINYNNFIIRFTEGIELEEHSRIILPKGRYLTLNFDDDYKEPRRYYDKMKAYIKDRDIKVIGDFFEIYIITRVTKEGNERALGKIQIKIE